MNELAICRIHDSTPFTPELQYLAGTHSIKTRPLPMPFLLLSRTNGLAAECYARFERPCEALFEYLAVYSPEGLLTIVQKGKLEPYDLTYAVRAFSSVLPNPLIKQELMRLTEHAVMYVREGALFGLSAYLSENDVVRRIEHLSKADASPGVKEAAAEILAR